MTGVADGVKVAEGIGGVFVAGTCGVAVPETD